MPGFGAQRLPNCDWSEPEDVSSNALLGSEPPHYRDKPYEGKDDSGCESREDENRYDTRCRVGWRDLWSSPSLEPIKVDRRVRGNEIFEINLDCCGFATVPARSECALEKLDTEAKESCLVGNDLPLVGPTTVLVKLHVSAVSGHLVVEKSDRVLDLSLIHRISSRCLTDTALSCGLAAGRGSNAWFRSPKATKSRLE